MTKYPEVVKVLKKVPKLQRIAGKGSGYLSSYVPDGMPHNKPALNNADNKIIERLEALQKLDEILFCLSFLSDTSQKILRLKYMTGVPTTDVAIAMDLGISTGTFYRWQNKALLEFREAYFRY
ncbi:ArpU family phage packaging/lysis transcriptional regulator [Pediococcus argentinicus]|uniref:ArpU family phage packaging/lysis transcriptional regulator n=1 Tax=Pediococcus argentinicus TaxID=480391 RepID=UPI00339007BE